MTRYTDLELLMCGPEVQAAIDSDNKKSRKAKSIADCGKAWFSYNPATGQVQRQQNRCKYPRECRLCLRSLAWRQSEFVKTASITKNLSYLICTIDEFRKLTKGQGKKSYKRFPAKDEGVEFLLLDADTYDVGEPVDFDWVIAQDWQEICFGRENSKMSGSLITPASPVDPPAFSIIPVQGIVSDAPFGEQQEIMQAAKDETDYLDPRTPAEVKDALMERLEVALKKMRAKNYNPRIYTKKLKLVHSEIDWKKRFSIEDNNTDAETLPKYIQGSLDPPIAQN